MPLSESERRVLVDLEQHLRPSVATRAVIRWSNITTTQRTLAASAAVSTGVLSIGVALAFTGAVRILIVLVAYLLIVGGVAVIVDSTSRSRRAAGRPKARFDARPTRYFR